MRDRYEPAEFESAWRERWKTADLFHTRISEDKPKFYGLDFFPYPSGAGLSVGHCRNYIPTDVICRMKLMQGFSVLHPMGFDAFGLPAENEAIKNKTHPAPMIDRYAKTYQRQMESIGIGYDWTRSFKSSDPGYYRWTQWIFKHLYDKGLAFRKDAEVNWCPNDKTALANEEVVAGLCERCGTPVEKRAIPQWFFKITDYAQRLIDDLDTVDWPEGIKTMQRNWIGRSEGVEFEMKVAIEGASSGPDETGFEVLNLAKPPTFRVFTTRIDTIFGMTFCVLAPEHPLVEKIKKVTTPEIRAELDSYQKQTKSLSDLDRSATTRKKTGVFTGAHAINPATGAKVPIYIADYVMTGYGTGAIMAVPAGDQRDLEFAIQFDIPVVAIQNPTEEFFAEIGDVTSGKSHDENLASYLEDPKRFPQAFVNKSQPLVNAKEYSGMSFEDAAAALGEWIEALGIGERKVNYKLRDWLISRQRYWGCPIPIVYDKEGNPETVPDDLLPVTLPDVDNYEPSDDGSSPLSRISDFVNVTTRDGALGRRETDTLGGFACSSWYFLRFCDPHNPKEPFSLDKVNYWMPVDCYVGGAEHAVMHLLYARFWTKVLYDAGLVHIHEPFQRLMNQGQVLALTPYRRPNEDETLGIGEEGVLVSFAEANEMSQDDLDWRWVRMSKSKGNVVTPEEAVDQYGADALRLFELFVAPFEGDVQWNSDGMAGTARFLSRFFRLASDIQPHYVSDWKNKINLVEADGSSAEIRRATHQLIKKASEDIERFAFNTYVAACMTFVNSINDSRKGMKTPSESEQLALSEALDSLVLVLAPAAPHSADEIWNSLGHEGFTYDLTWPTFNEALAREDVVTVAVQVNGKLRATIEASAASSKEDLEREALANERIVSFTEGLTVRKVIVIPGKLVNVVAN